MKKRKIVFDVDDTLWSLNKRVCKEINIPYENIITFSVYENPLLTDAEKEKLIAAYGNPEYFKNIQWFDGIERIIDLNADVYFHSNSMNVQCSKYKRKELRKVLDIPDDHIIIENMREKKIDTDTFIFVDDAVHNILASNAEYNIMIRTPWNQSICVKELLKKNVIVCENLNQVIDMIEEILEENVD